LQKLEGRFLGFSPDGKNIVAGNDNGTVRVWNLSAASTEPEKIDTPQTYPAGAVLRLPLCADRYDNTRTS